MALNIQNTNYSGEVLETLLTVAATGNELVEKGLIHVEPGVSDKFSIPRLKSGKMLQKRKEQPTDADSRGDFNYSERQLKPVDFMAFTTFNPRSFEKIWRKWQPTGNLVFAELPSEGQNALLAELAKQVKFELGFHFIQGSEGSDDDHLFNGILTRILADPDVLRVSSAETTMLGKLAAVKGKIPTTLRSNPGLRILMSVDDFDRYDDELTAQPNKGANYTDTNVSRYKGIGIEYMASWPSGVIVATITGMDINTNLWAGVNLQDDMEVIQIDKLTNAGERYFFKMLMKADTQIAFGEECVLLDSREQTLTVNPTTLAEYTKNGGAKTVTITASADQWQVAVDGMADWITAEKSTGKVSITTQANTGTARSGSVTVSLGAKSATIAVSQAAGNV
ncbi:MAG: BACON domain-containing protein [Alistipes sp.]